MYVYVLLNGWGGGARVRKSRYKKVKLGDTKEKGTLKGTRRYAQQKTLRRKEIWNKLIKK
jgi:hypothetical protein